MKKRAAEPSPRRRDGKIQATIFLRPETRKAVQMLSEDPRENRPLSAELEVFVEYALRRRLEELNLQHLLVGDEQNTVVVTDNGTQDRHRGEDETGRGDRKPRRGQSV